MTTTTETESRLEALERAVGAGQLAEIAIADERKRQAAAERAEAMRAAEAEIAAIHALRVDIAREWLAQAATVETALEALIAANDELVRIADRDDTLYRQAWQWTSGRPADRCPGGLDLPTLPMTLSRRMRLLVDEAERIGIRERAASPAP
jgi:hypothetical protein